MQAVWRVRNDNSVLFKWCISQEHNENSVLMQTKEMELVGNWVVAEGHTSSSSEGLFLFLFIFWEGGLMFCHNSVHRFTSQMLVSTRAIYH